MTRRRGDEVAEEPGGRVVAALRLGIVGCGFVAERRHLPTLRRLPEVDVVALADTDAARCRQLGATLDSPACFESVQQLLEHAEVEAVAVCTPAPSHAEVALVALDAGKHVFVEKPITLSLVEADRLIERARESAAVTTVGFNLRYHVLVEQGRRLLREGAVGRVTAIASRFTDARLAASNLPAWRGRRHLGGGGLLEKLIHHFDLWRFLLDDEVEDVYAVSRCERADDETTVVSARMRNGALAQATGADRTSVSNEITIYGEEGSLLLDLYRFDGLVRSSLDDLPGAPTTRLRRMLVAAGQLARHTRELRAGGLFDATYAAEWRAFAAAVRGRGQPASTFEDGRKALQIALAAAESATLGRPVKIVDAASTMTPTRVPV
jgi:predicted dehydrogenase